jgi:hypothetical protein
MDPRRSTRRSQDPVWHQHSLLDRAEALEEEALFEDDTPEAHVARLRAMTEEHRIATLARWAARLDQLNAELERQLQNFAGTYRQFAQEEIVAERDALADRIAHCCQVLADLPGPESRSGPDRGPAPPAT